MGLGFAGGIAAFAKGAQDGVDRQRKIDEEDRNIAWTESQRKITATQQARDEAARVANMQVGKDRTEATAQAGPGMEQADGTEAKMPTIQMSRPATMAETLSDLANVRRTAGDAEGYVNARQAATTSVDTEQKRFETRLADAVASGDSERVKTAINGVGTSRVSGAIAMTPMERELPGYGKVPTFNATFKVVNPVTGEVREQTINSHDLQMRAQPFLTQNSINLQGNKEASDADLKKAHIKYYGVSADAMTTKANAAADKVLMTVDKFEPSDQAAIKTLNEQQSIDYTAMSKGLADGSMTVTSPNYLVLKERYDIRGAQSQKIYKKYAAPASAPEMSDFNKGFYPSPPAGAPAPAAAPASAVKGRTGNPMFDAIVQTESNGNPNAVSPKGAKGLMQVMPGTNSDPGFGVTPARDNSEGERTRVGQDYFTKMQTRYNGNDALAAIAYNWGPGNTDTWLKNGGDYKKLPAETQSYVSQVLTRSGVNNQSRSGAPAAVTPAAARPAIASLTATAQDDSTPGGVTPTAGSASDSPGTGIGATPSEPRAQVVTAAGGVTPNSKTIKPATPPSRSASGAITSPADATEMTANDARLAKRTINYTGLIDEVAPTRGKAGGYSYKGKIYPTKQAAIDALYNS